MKWYLTYLLIFLGWLTVHTQNLVLNPSFEDTTNCPSGPNQIDSCKHWSNPNEGETPDYFIDTDCFGFNTLVRTPSNFVGYAIPRTGIAYGGIIAYSVNAADYNYREVLQGKLYKPLDSGETYCGGFYVQLANRSGRVIDAMGMYFDNDSAAVVWPPYTPSIYDPNPYINNPSGNYLNDTVNWVPVEGMFVANGGEKFLLIGNLKDYTNVTVQVVDSIYAYAYYYVEDVFLYDHSPVFTKEQDTTICDSLGQVTLRFHADNAPHYSWYEANTPANILSNTDSLIIPAPTTTTSYVVRGNACGYISYDTITVTIIDCEPPVEIVPDVITPNGDGVNDELIIKNLQPNSHLSIYNRWGGVIYETANYQNDWPSIQNSLTDGVYFYVFTNPQNQEQHGFVHVFNQN